MPVIAVHMAVRGKYVKIKAYGCIPSFAAQKNTLPVFAVRNNHKEIESGFVCLFGWLTSVFNKDIFYFYFSVGILGVHD